MLFLKRCPARWAFLLEHPIRRRLLQPDRLIRSLRLQPGARVLDVGTGAGVIAAAIANHLERGELVLVDPQYAMLTRAQRRVKQRAQMPVSLLSAVAENLPLKDSSVDFALLVTVLGEVDDAHLTLEEMRRVLRRGGVLSITEHLPDPDFRAASKVRALVTRYGFAERDFSGGRWSYTINFVKTDT
ncbi:MAG TPA: methyltransferase domain-containing protein [Gemmatimonadaceae bacterium]|nr:methyltransferase domain-containing protein [Gemmatimonadaceae bacterium]